MGVFAIVPGRVQKGLPQNFSKMCRFVFCVGRLTTSVGNGISHCAARSLPLGHWELRPEPWSCDLSLGVAT